MANIQHKNQMVQYIEQRRPAVYRAANKNERLMEKIYEATRLALYENPALATCDPGSLLRAMLEAARLGFIPGSLGHCYFVPRGKRVTLDIGYRGLIWLADKSEIFPIDAAAVKANDAFEVTMGTTKSIVHKPVLDGGETVAFYAVATLRRDGEFMDKAFTVMSADDVRQIRDRYSKNSAAWKHSFDEMGKKTAIKRLIKGLAISTRLQEAIAVDGRELLTDADVATVETGEVQDAETPAPLAELLEAHDDQ